MTPLPFDVTRCKPEKPDKNCKNCRRWADHPKQTHGFWQSYVLTTNSKDKACIYYPTSLTGEKR